MGDLPGHLCAFLMNTDDASGGIRAPYFHPCWGVPSPVQGSNCGFPERGPASPAPPRTGAVSLIGEPGGIPGDTSLLAFLIRASE